jgi:hypothetical protein
MADMRPKLKWLLICIGALAICSGLAVYYIRTHPLVFNESFLGHAHCMKGGGIALQTYAAEHGDKYPYHTNGYGDALLLMTNEVCGWWESVTGPGYDAKPFLEALATGSHLPEEKCGRVYVQGLTTTDDPEIVLLFDKRPTPGGDHCHLFARMRHSLTREVWTINVGMNVVLERDWPAFSRHQIELLVAAGIPKAEAERLYAQRPRP